MAKIRLQPLRSIIIERIKNSPRARQFIADYAKAHGKSIDPENWKELLAFLKTVLETILPLILKFI